jgi:K+-transporting ATPase ATPase B chain
MSGVDLDGISIRKGASDAITAYVKTNGNGPSPELEQAIERIARNGGTPLSVARNGKILG